MGMAIEPAMVRQSAREVSAMQRHANSHVRDHGRERVLQGRKATDGCQMARGYPAILERGRL